MDRVVRGLDVRLGFDDIPVLYRGAVRHRLLNSIADTSFELLEEANLPHIVCKRAYSASIEMLQNVERHAPKSELGSKPLYTLYAMDYDEREVQVLTANLIPIAEIPALKARLEELNAPEMTEDMKRMRYQVQLNEGIISEKGGAGLGLIEVSKKVHSPIEYRFLPCDERYYYFLMCVRYA